MGLGTESREWGSDRRGGHSPVLLTGVACSCVAGVRRGEGVAWGLGQFSWQAGHSSG